MTEFGALKATEDGFVFACPELDLTVEGARAASVLAAVADILESVSEIEAEAGANLSAVTVADGSGRCRVRFGSVEYTWVGPHRGAAQAADAA